MRVACACVRIRVYTCMRARVVCVCVFGLQNLPCFIFPENAIRQQIITPLHSTNNSLPSPSPLVLVLLLVLLPFPDPLSTLAKWRVYSFPA